MNIKRNLVIIFTGTVATSLADKIICSYSIEEYNVTSVFTEKSQYFVDMDFLLNKHFYIFTDKHEWLKEKYSKDDLIPHIDFAKTNDCLLIIASADFISKMVNGICDDLASSLYRAWHRYKPVVVAPAMNTHMWNHPITLKHIEQLQEWNVKIVNPIEKKLACGDYGVGALANIPDIETYVRMNLDNDFPLINYNGIPVGKEHPGSFLYPRKHGLHTGVDLYTRDGEPVFAMNDGKVISVEHFTGTLDKSTWWEDTYCILIQHWFGVVCYGELTPDVLVGTVVKRGEKIGNIKRVLKLGKERPDIAGHSCSMLHIELYPNGQKKASNTYAKDKDILRDPTPYLLGADTEESNPKKLLY